MALIVDGAREAPVGPDPDGTGDPGAAQRRLADELLDELTQVKTGDRGRMLRAWQHNGVSVIQLSAANVLEAHGPMSMGRFAEALGVSVASATGVVGRMEERGLVVRHHDEGDRRIVIVSPASGAKDLFRAMEQARREHLSRLVARLTEDELAGFLTGLRALRAAREQLEVEG